MRWGTKLPILRFYRESNPWDENMNTSEETHILTKPFMVVALAPVVVLALAGILFVPLLGSMDISRGGWLADLVSSSNNPFIQDFILIIFLYCCLPISAIAMLTSPALTSFLVNRIYPAYTSRSRATLGGWVFLFFYMMFVVVLFFFRFLESLQLMGNTCNFLIPWKSLNFITYLFLILNCLHLNLLPGFLSLVGIALAYSVAMAGRAGAKSDKPRPKHVPPQPVP
jgi:hypothetical protein